MKFPDFFQVFQTQKEHLFPTVIFSIFFYFWIKNLCWQNEKKIEKIEKTTKIKLEKKIGRAVIFVSPGGQHKFSNEKSPDIIIKKIFSSFFKIPWFFHGFSREAKFPGFPGFPDAQQPC